MKFWISCAVSGLALVAVSSPAEPLRKTPTARAVDAQAAAKATAALYATSPAAQAAARDPGASKGLTPGGRKPSPLLPATPVSPQAAALAPAVAAPAAQSTDEVWAGAYQCELSEKVQLRPGLAADQVELQWKAQRWQLRRTDSHSGAMRLEDAAAHVVWIQLANKSMLLDQRQGKRLLDECQHEVQVQTAAQMKTNPPPALFDTSGMGR